MEKKEMRKKLAIAILGNYGWDVVTEEGGDYSDPKYVATRRWNLAEVNSDGDYKSFITDLKADIIDPLYIEYTLDLANERASYIYYPGGETGANCGEIEDDFAACLEAALEDTLFTPTTHPLKTVDVLRSDDKLRPCWVDLVQFTAEYSSCLFSAGAGSFAIRVQNNTNVRSDEPNEYFFISEEDASGILKEKEKESIDRIVDMMARIVDKVSERS